MQQISSTPDHGGPWRCNNSWWRCVPFRDSRHRSSLVLRAPLLFFAITSLFSSISPAQALGTKTGGVYFRVDDNHPVSQWQQYTALFDKYNLKTSIAINITGVSTDANAQSALRLIQSKGHEIIDHTPDHATQYFTGVSNVSTYSGRAGVDHINGNRICLTYQSIDSTTYPGSGYVDIHGNMILSRTTGEFKDMSGFTQIYFPSLGKFFNISSANNSNPANVDSLSILTAWDESIDLGVLSNVRYKRCYIWGATLTDDAIRLLGERSSVLFSQSGFGLPFSYAQPGTYTPYLNRKDIKRVFAQYYQYQSGATYWDESVKVFDEYDPESDKRYSMMWGDFDEENTYARTMETYIANRVAKHYVVAGHSHFNGGIGGWNGYLGRVDSLLGWCVRSGIQVKTQTEWAGKLYGVTTNPYENIIPQLNTDLDGNSIPDGYYASVDGYVDKTDGIPDKNYYAYAINKSGRVCLIQQLGGLEKGDNDFVFWMKGTAGSTLAVIVTMPGHTAVTLNYPVTSSTWKKYSLSDATSQPASVNIPADVSYLDLDFWSNTPTGGTLKVSGMEMRKPGLPLPGIPALSQPANNSLSQPVSLTLQWHQAQNATTYRVQLATDSLFSAPVVDDSSLSATNRAVGPLAKNTRYYWRVNSKNAAGQSPWSSVWGFGTVVAIPEKPVLYLPAKDSKNQPVSLTLQWRPAARATSYHVQLALVSGFRNLIVDDPGVTTTSRPVNNLANNVQYYWRVRAENLTGESAWSSTWRFTTIRQGQFQKAYDVTRSFGLISPQDGDTLQSGMAATVFRWQTPASSSGPLTFTLSIGGADHDTTLENIADTAYVFDGRGFFQEKVDYSWSVTAMDAQGTSTPSGNFQFTTGGGFDSGGEQRSNLLTYGLEQNYPNPFNPSTIIRYVLPTGGNVTLEVYNTLGQVVARLVDEFREAGVHETIFDANGLASGLYFYRLKAGEYVQAKKLLLVR